MGHRHIILHAILCGFWLLISALANFSQAFLSPSQLLFSKSGCVHQELLLNNQTDSTPSPCVLCCLHLCVGCGQSKPISAFWSVSPLVQFRLFGAIPHYKFGWANKYEKYFSGSGWKYRHFPRNIESLGDRAKKRLFKQKSIFSKWTQNSVLFPEILIVWEIAPKKRFFRQKAILI